MNNTILLCTDLDRTLIPNGDAIENENARARFRRLCTHPEIRLIYVSGRDIHRVSDAIHSFNLPEPDFIIADVGSSIYQKEYATNNQPIDQKVTYREDSEWSTTISEDWKKLSAQDIIEYLGEMTYAKLQPNDQQGTFKISYHVTPSSHLDNEASYIRKTLKNKLRRFNCICSIDETCDQGLIDILPASANKKLAVDFLVSKLNIVPTRVFFSGDSGNDLDMLTSGYLATLVNNATNDVKQTAIELAQKKQCVNTLYIAHGTSITNVVSNKTNVNSTKEKIESNNENGISNNGNYANGIIEGFLHYFPHYTEFVNLE